MIGHTINGYKVVAAGMMARDMSVLLGVSTDSYEQRRTDRYVVASIATSAVLDSSEHPPTFWSSGHYTSDLDNAIQHYLADLESDPVRFSELVHGLVERVEV